MQEISELLLNCPLTILNSKKNNFIESRLKYVIDLLKRHADCIFLMDSMKGDYMPLSKHLFELLETLVCNIKLTTKSGKKVTFLSTMRFHRVFRKYPREFLISLLLTLEDRTDEASIARIIQDAGGSGSIRKASKLIKKWEDADNGKGRLLRFVEPAKGLGGVHG